MTCCCGSSWVFSWAQSPHQGQWVCSSRDRYGAGRRGAFPIPVGWPDSLRRARTKQPSSFCCLGCPAQSRGIYANPGPGWRRVSRLADRDALLAARRRRDGRRQLHAPRPPSRARYRQPDADQPADGPDRGLASARRSRDPGRGHGHLRLPAVAGVDREVRARHDHPLRRDPLGAVLDDRPGPRVGDPAQQRRRHAQRAVRDARGRAERAPREARDDGRVRHPEHRHRRGLHRHRAQRPDGSSAVPEAAGQLLPPVQGARLAQPALRVSDLGAARDGPEPGCGVRHPHRRDRARRSSAHPLRLRRALRHRAEPLLRAVGHRSPDHRVRGWKPDSRLPQHPRHAAVHRAREPQSRRTRARCGCSTSSPRRSP